MKSMKGKEQETEEERIAPKSGFLRFLNVKTSMIEDGWQGFCLIRNMIRFFFLNSE